MGRIDHSDRLHFDGAPIISHHLRFGLYRSILRSLDQSIDGMFGKIVGIIKFALHHPSTICQCGSLTDKHIIIIYLDGWRSRCNTTDRQLCLCNGTGHYDAQVPHQAVCHAKRLFQGLAIIIKLHKAVGSDRFPFRRNNTETYLLAAIGQRDRQARPVDGIFTDNLIAYHDRIVDEGATSRQFYYQLDIIHLPGIVFLEAHLTAHRQIIARHNRSLIRTDIRIAVRIRELSKVNLGYCRQNNSFYLSTGNMDCWLYIVRALR